MKRGYNYSLLKKILLTKVNGVSVWKKRIRLQTQFLHLLEDALDTDISSESFGFYPGRIYFATSLTGDIEYTKKMKPIWHKINVFLRKMGYDVYAPFDVTDPHQKIPDNLNSAQIRDLDHINVLKAEIGLMDLNRPAHGVGQEIEMSMFMPTIAFSQGRVSRLSKGMPGMLIFHYKDIKELLQIIKEIFKRRDYKKEPFYVAKCPKHIIASVWKGRECQQCKFEKYLHEM